MQRLLDMHLEQQIDFGTYEDKKLEIIKEQQLKTTELKRLQGEADIEKDLRKRLDAMRKLLSDAPILKEFDRNVFESIVEKVIVGGYDDEGNADPSMITFVYKTGFEDKKKGDDYKPPRRNSKSKKLSSQPTDDSSKLSQQATDVAYRKCGTFIPQSFGQCFEEIIEWIKIFIRLQSRYSNCIRRPMRFICRSLKMCAAELCQKKNCRICWMIY